MKSSLLTLFPDPCSGVVCGAGPGECAPTRQCVLGQCIAVPLPLGTRCSLGSCAAGVCRNPCANVTCASNSTTCQQPVCEDQGGMAVCVLRPRTDGSYPLAGPSLLPPSLLASPTAQCAAGEDVCGSPLSMLPRAFPGAPPVFPRAPSGGFVLLPTTAVAPTTAADTTTSEPPPAVITTTTPFEPSTTVTRRLERSLSLCLAGRLVGSTAPCECPAGCRACHQGPDDTCTLCAMGLALHAGRCVTQCPAGMVSTAVSGRGIVCSPAPAPGSAASDNLAKPRLVFHAPAPQLSLTPMVRLPQIAQPATEHADPQPAARSPAASVAWQEPSREPDAELKKEETEAQPAINAASVHQSESTGIKEDTRELPSALNERESSKQEEEEEEEETKHEEHAAPQTPAPSPAATGAVRVLTVVDSMDVGESDAALQAEETDMDAQALHARSAVLPVALVAGLAVVAVVVAVVVMLSRTSVSGRSAKPLLPLHSPRQSRSATPDAFTPATPDSAVGSMAGDEGEEHFGFLHEDGVTHYDERGAL